jgi:hypothetical protein
MHRRVGCIAGLDPKLFEQVVKAQPVDVAPSPMPIAPFSSWLHIAITARAKRGSLIPGIASRNCPERKAVLSMRWNIAAQTGARHA